MSRVILAFDYGTNNIGMACSQTAGSASELPALKARDGIPNWQELQKILEQWQPQLCVVGLPLNMDDSDNPITVRARKFANRLHGRFGIKVELMDERLSTREAKAEAMDRGHRGNFQQAPIDSIAARLILESWLSQNPTDS